MPIHMPYSPESGVGFRHSMPQRDYGKGVFEGMWLGIVTASTVGAPPNHAPRQTSRGGSSLWGRQVFDFSKLLPWRANQRSATCSKALAWKGKHSFRCLSSSP